MKLPHVSIIMPAFNVLPWLGQAVASVRLQTGVSWELLIIDDGSTDGTLELAKQYAAEDDRIRVLDNMGRKGASGARNTGIHAAAGGACMFMDSDDALFPGALESLRKELEASGLPVVRGLGALFCMQRRLYFPDSGLAGGGSSQELRGPSCSFCFHMYRTDFLREHAVLFPEDLTMGEDRTFLCLLYSLLSEVPVVRRMVYLYRINHKQIRPSASKALSFAEYTLRVRTGFEERGRHAWIVPYLEKNFLPHWLPWLHAARAESQEQALNFLESCGKAIAGLEEGLRPALLRQLGASGAEFLVRLGESDTPGMLAALQRSGRVAPYPAFLGIDREPQGFSWTAYRALSLIRNVLLSPRAWHIHWYFARLRRMSVHRRPLPGIEYASGGQRG